MGWFAQCTRPSALTAMTASCMLFSRVSSWRWLERTAAKLCSICPAVLIDGCGNASDFVERSVVDAGAKIAAANAGSDIDDAFQTAGSPGRSHSGNQKSNETGEKRSPNQRAAYLRLDRLDVGKRIGEANRAARNRSGDIEKRDTESGAAALVLAGLAGKGGGKLGAGGVVLHVRGIGFRICKDFAGRVDDRGAGSGGSRFLRSDFGERVDAIGVDSVRE